MADRRVVGGPLALATACVFVFAACTGGETGSDAGDGGSAGAQHAAGEEVTTASGLKYQVLTPGDGKQPTLQDSVTVHYRGTLTDGREFDSSHRRGKPATFPVRGVIAGWTEALQLMKEGAKWKLTIPPALAYGERGAGAIIGPNETLIFEVELLKVN